MKVVYLMILFQTVHSDICNTEFDDTTCEYFEFAPETVLNSATNKITIRNATGKVIHENFSKLDEVTEIKITRCDLTDIETGVLCCVPNITSISITRNKKFPTITRSLLRNCQHVKKIYLDGNEISVNNNAFVDVPNLLTLSLNATNLPKIVDKTTFSGLTSLKSLIIHNSALTLKPDAFANLFNLMYLDLQGNGIQTIAPETFKTLTKLRVLNLSDNKLTNLTWSEFDGLKALKVLFLEHNDFSDVDVTKLVAGVPKLERIFLSYDKLTAESRKRVEETLPKLGITFIYIGKPVL